VNGYTPYLRALLSRKRVYFNNRGYAYPKGKIKIPYFESTNPKEEQAPQQHRSVYDAPAHYQWPDSSYKQSESWFEGSTELGKSDQPKPHRLEMQSNEEPDVPYKDCIVNKEIVFQIIQEILSQRESDEPIAQEINGEPHQKTIWEGYRPDLSTMHNQEILEVAPSADHEPENLEGIIEGCFSAEMALAEQMPSEMIAHEFQNAMEFQAIHEEMAEEYQQMNVGAEVIPLENVLLMIQQMGMEQFQMMMGPMMLDPGPAPFGG